MTDAALKAMAVERVVPGPGQESVWDYPRPPRVEPWNGTVQVYFAGQLIAETENAKRVLETSHPPNFYVPFSDVRREFLDRTGGGSWCEWKGRASYLDIVVGDEVSPRAAWYYPDPVPPFESLADHLSFYPGRTERCVVDGETVRAQPGDFYGGWITDRVVGPFKGAPGTLFW